MHAEDRRYFDAAVTGVPCYFSSKKLERVYTLYSCPALSGYLLCFHGLWICCTLVVYLVCVGSHRGIGSSRRVAVPFVVGWLISLLSILVVFIWRRSGGKAAEQFNTREKALLKADDATAAPMREAVHWRACFTEDFGTWSIGLVSPL